jgi:hypothetical protein
VRSMGTNSGLIEPPKIQHRLRGAAAKFELS